MGALTWPLVASGLEKKFAFRKFEFKMKNYLSSNFYRQIEGFKIQNFAKRKKSYYCGNFLLF